MGTSLRVERSTVGRQVADRLRDAVADGRLPPGERLTERALCELTGAGRASVREALRALEAEGVIENAPHRGPTVARVGPAQARDLYAVRALLEGFAARGFARRAGEADRAALEAALRPVGEAARALGAGPGAANLLTVEVFAHAAGLLLLAHTGRIRMFGASAPRLMEAYVEDRIARFAG